MRKMFQFRIYPTKNQEVALLYAGICTMILLEKENDNLNLTNLKEHLV